MNNTPRILVLQMGGDAPLDPGPRFVDKTRADNFGPRSIHPSDFIGVTDFRHLFLGKESVNFVPEDWQELARVIVDANDMYDGFVVWHGTDTLAWAATTLSFLLENLSKPVVVSGPNHSAAIELVNTNLHSAIRIASHSALSFSQVVVCFGSVVLQGNRAIQVAASGDDQFQSHRGHPIARILNAKIFIEDKATCHLQSSTRKPSVNPMNWANTLHIMAMNSPKLFQPLIKGCHVESIILELSPGYVNGELKQWSAFLREASRNNILTVLTLRKPCSPSLAEQCAGTDFVLCDRLTLPALMAKLGILRGAQLPRADIQRLLDYDFRGELDNAAGRVRDLWTLRAPPTQVIELVREIDSELLTYLSRHPRKLYSLHPRGFEDLVAKIFRYHGYEVMLTQETRDGGYDFRGILVDGLGTQFITYVETKRYAEDRPIGVAVVRGVYGVIAAEGASRGIIVTTSRFTRDARAFQQTVANTMTLYDYDDLSRWLSELP